jgi:hypothetical protein
MDVRRQMENSMSATLEMTKKLAETKLLLIDKLYQKLENSDDLTVGEMREIREMLKELSSNK